MKESDVQKAAVKYLSMMKGNLIVVSDPNGIRLTIGQATQLKKMRLPPEGGHPDILVLEPKGEYHGLFIEVKKEGTKIYKKDGSHASEHVQKQSAVHDRLRLKGYFGGFACGVDQCVSMIEEYLL